MTKYIIKNEKDTLEFAKKLMKKLKAKDIVCLTGDLGVGKTFLVKCISKILGINEDVISPTFNIIKSYDVKLNKKANFDKNIKKLNHFDVYRIKTEEELVDIGFFDIIYENNSLCVIEWADLINNSIPKNALWINIKLKNKLREITVQ